MLPFGPRFIFKVGNIRGILPVIAPLVGDDRFPPSSYEPLGAVGLTLMSWLSCLQGALKLHEKQPLDAIIRYEELVVQKADLVRRVLKACGFPVSEDGLAANVEKVFEEDAHGDNAK